MTPALMLLDRAEILLSQAGRAEDADERFRLAHLAALRVGAAALPARRPPAANRGRMHSVWQQLERLTPEYAEWAIYFGAGARARAAIEAGAVGVVTVRAAEDLCRAVDQFRHLVETRLGGASVPPTRAAS
jgi:hypothetical protein